MYRKLFSSLSGAMFILVLVMSSPYRASAQQDAPWRLIEPSAQTRFQFNQLLRLETLDGQFRAGRQGSSDQILLARTIMTGEIHTDDAALTIEILDARQALADSGSSLSNGMVNTASLEQLYGSFRSRDLLQAGSSLDFKIGRQTVDVGSRRLIARSAFSTAPLAFDGAMSTFTSAGGKRLQAFYLVPVQANPSDLDELLDNRTVRDRQSDTVRLWGVFAELPALTEWLRGEFYYFRMIEEDTRRHPATANRRLGSAGARLLHPASAGQVDFELETVVQRGTLRASTATSDMRDLRQRAYFFHAEVGYSFEAAWRPRLQLQFDHASGDKDPADASNERFDTLFGDRRFDFGPTSLYGTFARSNLISAGYRLTATPANGVRLMVAHREFRLADERDAWVGSGLRDSSGNSGNRLGQQLEARVQWDVVEGNLTLEGGFALYDASGFARSLPGVPAPATTRYFYMQSLLSF